MRVLIDKEIRVQMSDGVTLATDVYRPQTRQQLPTLVQRTPYDKNSPSSANASVDVVRATAAGYAVVIQDVRGRYGSQGRFEPFVNEASDGAETLAWVRAQPWSNGVLGMIGPSYVGATQWLAASSGPAGLGAIAPMVTGDDYFEGWTYSGGALQLGFQLHWALNMLGAGEAQRLLAAKQIGSNEVEELLEAIDNTE
ncbi:MAG: CocE/NonD family hydrolase, partial [Propionibacteriaceae bacterium]|nr:CocE/NonD family hydrolase [Propionibacteriaceae bacterium]